MIATIELDIGSPARSKPTEAELAAALGLSSVTDAASIISASWTELESFAGRLWGARPVTHRFRLLAGSEAAAFPGYRPVADSVTLRRWSNGNGWAGDTTPRYEPDGILRDLSEGELYEVEASNLGNLGSQQPPKPVLEAVLRLAAWRASHRGGAFLPVASGPMLAGYMLTDAIRRSGAGECIAPYVHFGGGA